jgi:hypothetical protein
MLHKSVFDHLPTKTLVIALQYQPKEAIVALSKSEVFFPLSCLFPIRADRGVETQEDGEEDHGRDCHGPSHSRSFRLEASR